MNIERNPLTGQPLQPGQTLVSGPLFTGPRVTVVWRDAPGTWPHWITSVNGVPTDDGTIPGGTWDGTRAGLPGITVTGNRSLLFQALLLILTLAAIGVVVRAVRGRK